MDDVRLLEYAASTGDTYACEQVRSDAAYAACVNKLWEHVEWDDCSAYFFAGESTVNCENDEAQEFRENPLCKRITGSDSEEDCVAVMEEAATNGTVKEICGAYPGCYLDAARVMEDVLPCTLISDYAEAGNCAFAFASKHDDPSACAVILSPRKHARCERTFLTHPDEAIPFCERRAADLYGPGMQDMAEGKVTSSATPEQLGNCAAETFPFVSDGNCDEILEIVQSEGDEFLDGFLAILDKDADGVADISEPWFCEDELLELVR